MCDEVSKIKNMKSQFLTFFRAARHGGLVFYPGPPQMGLICHLKSSILAFLEKGEISQTVLHKSVGKKQKIKIPPHAIWKGGQEDRFAPKTYFHGRPAIALLL